MSGLMYGWTDGLSSERWTDKGPMDGWLDPWIEGWMGGCVGTNIQQPLQFSY